MYCTLVHYEGGMLVLEGVSTGEHELSLGNIRIRAWHGRVSQERHDLLTGTCHNLQVQRRLSGHPWRIRRGNWTSSPALMNVAGGRDHLSTLHRSTVCRAPRGFSARHWMAQSIHLRALGPQPFDLSRQCEHQICPSPAEDGDDPPTVAAACPFLLYPGCRDESDTTCVTSRQSLRS